MPGQDWDLLRQKKIIWPNIYYTWTWDVCSYFIFGYWNVYMERYRLHLSNIVICKIPLSLYLTYPRSVFGCPCRPICLLISFCLDLSASFSYVWIFDFLCFGSNATGERLLFAPNTSDEGKSRQALYTQLNIC